jgi:hypothetical protein
MKQTEKTNTLLQSLVEAQAEFETLPKDKAGYGYNYTDLDTVISYIRPILKKYGLGFIQMLSTLEGNQPAITTRLIHSSGEWIEDTTPLPPVQLAKGNAAQNLGAAITYMKRYTLCAMLGISSDEDVDGKPAPSDTRGSNHDVPAQKQTNGPAGGPDTKEQHDTIKQLLETKYPDGKPMFADEKGKVAGWRKERTATQVIEYLNSEVDKRMGVYFEDAKAIHDEAKGKTEKVTEKEEEGAQQAFDVF